MLWNFLTRSFQTRTSREEITINFKATARVMHSSRRDCGASLVAWAERRVPRDIGSNRNRTCMSIRH